MSICIKRKNHCQNNENACKKIFHIFNLRKAGKQKALIAKELNSCRTTIGLVLAGLQWKHLRKDLIQKGYQFEPLRVRGDITPAQIEEITKLRSLKISMPKIAKRMGLKFSMVRYAVENRING